MAELKELAIDLNNIENTEEAIGQLMDSYSDDVLHLVFSYVKNRTTAEDLTQEIFIKCYEKLVQFNHHSSIKRGSIELPLIIVRITCVVGITAKSILARKSWIVCVQIKAGGRGSYLKKCSGSFIKCCYGITGEVQGSYFFTLL